MKKFLKLLLIMGVFLGSSMLFSACDDDIILVTGVDLYTNEIYADVNDTIDLSYKVYPSNASNAKVTFWSTDENIASVDESGKVTVKAFGEASIVVRSVDGGFEDYCKIITNVDPDQITWDTSDKLTEVVGQTYSASGSMALNQVMKLKLNYMLEGVVSDEVTNKNVVFTSSNPANIEVINEAEGIIKAINNDIIEGERAYSDITATLKTANGVLAITSRIYINEYSSLENLNLRFTKGDSSVLNQRNGTETIYLTSGGEDVEFYAYLTNAAGVVKTDYDMSIVSSSETYFTVNNITCEKGIYKFKLRPNENEGSATLYLRTSCSDENGKTIRCTINVAIQAEINSAAATATKRISESGDEVILNGEIFSVQLTYFDADGNKIEGAQRDIYFDAFNETTGKYLANYGHNQFKVTGVPTEEDSINPLQLTGYFYVENVDSSEKITFKYEFYIRNSLESLIVSQTPKDDVSGKLPSVGVSSITIPVGGKTTTLYAYATTFDFSLKEPTIVNATVLSGALVTIGSGASNSYIIRSAEEQGEAKILFVATDGLVTIEYEVTVYVVASVATINFYTDEDLSDKVETITVSSGETSLRLYLQITPNDGYTIECESAIRVESKQGTIGEIVSGNSVIRYIDIDLTQISSGDKISVTAERVLATGSITIEIV